MMGKVKIFIVFLFVAVFLSGCISIPPPSSTAPASTNIGTTPTSAPIPEGSAQVGVPDLGLGADMHGFLPFPPDNPWNEDISALPADPDSNLLISTLGVHPLQPDFGTVWNGAPNGIPYLVVSGSQPKVKVSFDYAEESDKVSYPIPPDTPIEGGPQSSGDRHILIIDRDAKTLYELYAAYPNSDGSWKAGSGAVFNLTSNALRPARSTSADAAGLPIFPGLVRYDEVVGSKEIKHALRFTVPKTREAFVCPARHYASTLTDAKYPPMGARFRLKASFNISEFPENEQVILRALKKYGMILADNGGTMFLSGAPDSRWNDQELALLKNVKTTDFEVVKMPTPTGPEGEAQTC
jgi:hypothetical protein